MNRGRCLPLGFRQPPPFLHCRRPSNGRSSSEAVLKSGALFLAWGPTVRAGATVDPIRNVDVYPFMAELLGLEPAPDLDGRAGYIKGLLTK
jgi:hypothetical protein